MDFGGTDDARDRRRQSDAIRTGLFICAALIMLDYMTSAGSSSSSSSSGQSGASSSSSPYPAHPAPGTGGGGAFKPAAMYFWSNETASLQGAAGAEAFRNLSSIYRGSWIGQSNFTRSNKKSVRSKGSVVFQLRSVDLPGLQDAGVQFVYGVAKVSGGEKLQLPQGAGDRFVKDLYYPIQGVYLGRRGSLALAITPQRRNKVFLRLARPQSAAESASVASSGASPSHRAINVVMTYVFGISDDQAHYAVSWAQRHLQGYLQASSLGQQGFLPVADPAHSMSPEELKYLEDVASGTVDNARVRALSESAYAALTGMEGQVSSRRLASSASPTAGLMPQASVSPAVAEAMTILGSVPLGDSGLELVSVELATSALPLSEASKPVGLGDDLLPTSFKSMQVSMGSSLHTACSDSAFVALQGVSSSTLTQKEIAAHATPYIKEMLGGFYSPLCGIQLNTSVTEYHIDMTRLGHKVSMYSMIVMGVCCVQIYIMISLMKQTEPQGASARISMLSIGAQSLLDAALCIGHLLMSVAIPSIFFYYFMWIAILKIVIYSVLEMRMIIGIYRARNLQNIDINNATALRRYLSLIHTRFFVALFVVMVLINMFYDKPVVLVFLLYSFWTPQIVHNAMEGTKQPYAHQYLWSITLSRIFIPLYFFGCPKNFMSLLLGHRTDSAVTTLVLVIWLLLQAAVLELQIRWGPRFFIPRRFLPVPYDYHRPIPPWRDQASSGAGRGSRRSTELTPLRQGAGGSSSSDVSNEDEDLDNITSENPLLTAPGSAAPASTGGDGGDLEAGDAHECVICYCAVNPYDGQYMITPCDHLFHEPCLSQWMDVKLECPVCRAPLPPVAVE